MTLSSLPKWFGAAAIFGLGLAMCKMTVELHKRGLFAWPEWAATLGAEIVSDVLTKFNGVFIGRSRLRAIHRSGR